MASFASFKMISAGFRGKRLEQKAAKATKKNASFAGHGKINHGLPGWERIIVVGHIDRNQAVLAAQDAFMDLLDLVDLVSEYYGPEERTALRQEAQKTVLMLIAAIVVLDGRYGAGKQAFVHALVDLRDKPGGDLRYLTEYAVVWTNSSERVPRFFHTAVSGDARNGTDVARKMLRRIQLIGNCANTCSGKFGTAEREMVTRYIGFLEDFIQAGREQELAESETAPARDSTDSTGDCKSNSGADRAVGGADLKGWLNID